MSATVVFPRPHMKYTFFGLFLIILSAISTDRTPTLQQMFHGEIISRNKRSVNSKTEQNLLLKFGTFVLTVRGTDTDDPAANSLLPAGLPAVHKYIIAALLNVVLKLLFPAKGINKDLTGFQKSVRSF